LGVFKVHPLATVIAGEEIHALSLRPFPAGTRRELTEH
jgi:hypothetical protein